MPSIVNHPVNTSFQLPSTVTISSKEEDEAQILKCIQDLVTVTTSFQLKWSEDSFDEDKPLLTLIEDVISELPVDPLCIMSSQLVSSLLWWHNCLTRILFYFSEKIARNLAADQKEPERSCLEHECLCKQSNVSSSANSEDSDFSPAEANNSDSELSELSSDESFSTAGDDSDELEIAKTSPCTLITFSFSLDTSQNPILDIRHEAGGAIATTRETPSGLGRHTRWSYPSDQRSLLWKTVVGIDDAPLSNYPVTTATNMPHPPLAQPENSNDVSTEQPSIQPVLQSESPRKRSLDEVDNDDKIDPPSPSRRLRTL